MAKADLQAAQAAYDKLIASARAAESQGRFAEAVATAMQAWEYVEDMMRFRRRYEDRAFKSVPCVDLVLRHAPFLMDKGVLDRLGELLRACKSIDRHSSDDLAQRLADARALLWQVHRLWGFIEQYPGTRCDELCERLGGSQKEWRTIAERLTAMGLVRQEGDGGSCRVSLATCMDDRIRGKCPRCGAIAEASKSAFLVEQSCPGCKAVVQFVIRDAGASRRG